MEATLLPSGLRPMQPQPVALTSGFTRPSAEGPRELKGALSRTVPTAPTASTSKASAGAPMWYQSELPLLPALITGIMPFCAAMRAAMLIRRVCPSRSA